VAVVPDDAVEVAVKEPRLGDDQAEAVRRQCVGGERVAVMVGPAGSGKTRGISAARAAWQSAGFVVRGVAPSAVAAGVLTEQAGMPSETLAKFLIEAGNGRVALQQDEVIVCVEECNFDSWPSSVRALLVP
jgi:ATP-dependent exoDNAse (exonuclease V) alpha subunit